NAGTERHRRRVSFAVPEIEHRDGVAGLAIADQRSQLLEALDGDPGESHDHVALAQSRARGAGSRHDARQPEAVVSRTGPGDRAEERTGRGAAGLTSSRLGDLGVDRSLIAREPLDDTRPA